MASTRPALAASLYPDEVPEDVDLKWRQLRTLLDGDPAFKTSFPRAYEILFPQGGGEHTPELDLQALGVQVPYRAPQPHVLIPRLGQEGDAFSATPSVSRSETTYTDYLPGILLHVLTDESVGDKNLPAGQREKLEALGLLDSPMRTTVGLGQLRLAELLKPGILEERLPKLLRELEAPLDRDKIIDWKLRLLRHPFKGVNERFKGDIRTGTVAVSFATVVLLLLLDTRYLRPREGLDEKNASVHTAKKVEEVAEVVRALLRHNTEAAQDLQKALSLKFRGRPATPESAIVMALRAYRLGLDKRLVAALVGLRTVRSRNEKMALHLKAGVEIEKQRYPIVADILARGSWDAELRLYALKALYFFLARYSREESEELVLGAQKNEPLPWQGANLATDLAATKVEIRRMLKNEIHDARRLLVFFLPLDFEHLEQDFEWMQQAAARSPFLKKELETVFGGPDLDTRQLWSGVGRDLELVGTTAEKLDAAQALVQMGFCLVHGRDSLP